MHVHCKITIFIIKRKIIQLKVIIDTIPQGSIAKELKRGVVLLYAMPFSFDVVKGMQPNHKYALIFVSAPLC